MPDRDHRPTGIGRFLRGVLVPVGLAVLMFLALREPIAWWLRGDDIYDQEAIKEWVREARVYQSLPELARSYLDLHERLRDLKAQAERLTGNDRFRLEGEIRPMQDRFNLKREEIQEHLKALGVPPTKIYSGQLPLFPVIYRLTVRFDPDVGLPPIVWDSQLPRQRSQYKELLEPMHADASVEVQYHLHAYLQRQFKERQEATRRLWLAGLGLAVVLLAAVWIYWSGRRERQRHERQLLAEKQLGEAERLRLEEELRRREAERRHEEMERQNLELKSRIFANIGIMAGSYAHNIKNLLVRPNDLLRRCREAPGTDPESAEMLEEIRQTLGTVTERLQQILHTVRRDPSKSQRTRIDLVALLRELQHTWGDLAQEKWKLDLVMEFQGDPQAAEPLYVEADRSHLQQALENLVFNARDATFEMRNHLRTLARQGNGAGNGAGNGPGDSERSRREALIAAAGWRGRIVLRTRRDGEYAVVEIQDNGIGMSEEVRRRCTETHFSTKRDNALYAGLSAGMGLGLSFVQVILDHHDADLEVESAPMQGTTFRVRFPHAPSSVH